jgi:Na+/pantothenate symporter
MRILFSVLGIISFLWGFLMLALSKSAIHEIQAYVMFLITVVLFVGAAVIDAAAGLRATLRSIEANTNRPHD